MASDRVADNRGANTPGIDDLSVAVVEEYTGVPGFLGGLRARLKQATFLPVVVGRVVRAALKLVLAPIIEADSKPVSCGFRPKRRAQDAISEIHFYGTHGYRWALEADIAACFDEIDHAVLMDRVRTRIKGKRILVLVKAFSLRLWQTSPCPCPMSTRTGPGSRAMSASPSAVRRSTLPGRPRVPPFGQPGGSE